MYELLLNQELCDVVLCVGKRRFPAHRVVLAGCCPYLRAMFTNGMQETGQDSVTLQDMEPELMELLLEYMYRGCVTITTTNVQSLLQAACLLHLASLRAACCHFLQLHIDAANCIGQSTPAMIPTWQPTDIISPLQGSMLSRTCTLALS